MCLCIYLSIYLYLYLCIYIYTCTYVYEYMHVYTWGMEDLEHEEEVQTKPLADKFGPIPQVKSLNHEP